MIRLRKPKKMCQKIGNTICDTHSYNTSMSLLSIVQAFNLIKRLVLDECCFAMIFLLFLDTYNYEKTLKLVTLTLC